MTSPTENPFVTPTTDNLHGPPPPWLSVWRGAGEQYSVLPEELQKIRLPVGRPDTTVDRQNHSIDKSGVITREECDRAGDIVGNGDPADF